MHEVVTASGNQFRALEALRATRVSERSDQGTPLRAAIHSVARKLWELGGFHLRGCHTLTKYLNKTFINYSTSMYMNYTARRTQPIGW